MFFDELYLFQRDRDDVYYDYVTFFFHKKTGRIIIVPDMLHADFIADNIIFKDCVKLDPDCFELVNGSPDPK